MTEVNYTGNQITINGRTIRIDYPVKTVAEINRDIIVLMEVPADEVCNRNVICFERDGSERWRIEPSKDGSQHDNPYMNLSIVEGDIIVEAWNGMRYLVDKETGSTDPKELRRF